MSEASSLGREEPWLLPELVEMLDDEMLLRAFSRSGGRDDPEAHAIVAEIERQGLDA